MRYYIILILFLLLNDFIYSNDDTLTVMQYNLMYYDNYTSYCTTSNNNVDTKDAYLATIANYVKPDILTVNEVNASTSSVQRILINALNINGITTYKRANFSGSYLANMIYYNSTKLELKSQLSIPTSPRQTDIYKLYLKTNQLALGDTIFLTCFVAHLKAGSTTADAGERALCAQQIIDFINTNGITGNILLMGDFNLYTALEQAFVNLTTPQSSGFRFFDPINQVGGWHDSYTYRNLHTQSTHTTSTGCHATGGFDDRFDFILASSPLFQVNNQLTFNKYLTLGQDGLRFNSSIVSPANSIIPINVVNALYGMSDHLPVLMKLYYNSNSTIAAIDHQDLIKFNNPFFDYITVTVNPDLPINNIFIVNLLGEILYSRNIPGNVEQILTIPTDKLSAGIYLLCIQNKDGYIKSYKIVKQVR